MNITNKKIAFIALGVIALVLIVTGNTGYLFGVGFLAWIANGEIED